MSSSSDGGGTRRAADSIESVTCRVNGRPKLSCKLFSSAGLHFSPVLLLTSYFAVYVRGVLSASAASSSSSLLVPVCEAMRERGRETCTGGEGERETDREWKGSFIHILPNDSLRDRLG